MKKQAKSWGTILINKQYNKQVTKGINLVHNLPKFEIIVRGFANWKK